MMPYIVFIVILFVLALLSLRTNKKNLFKIAAAVAFIFFAFRAPVVGADTWTYYKLLTGKMDINDLYEIRALEFGFLVYKEFCNKILFGNGVLVMVANTLFSLYGVYYMINKYSYNKTMSVLFFFFLFSYSVWFVATRQTIAFDMFLLGYLYLLSDKKNKWFVYALFSGAGCLTHSTILIYTLLGLVSYFLIIEKRFIYVLAIVISSIMGVVLDKFNPYSMFEVVSLVAPTLFLDRMEGYFDWDLLERSNSLYLGLVQGAFATMVILFMDKSKLNHPLTKMYIFGIIIGALLYYVPLSARLTFVFSSFGCVVFTWMFGKNFVTKKRSLILGLVVLWMLYFGQGYIKKQIFYDYWDDSKMQPYYFFFQDYSNHPSIKDYGR